MKNKKLKLSNGELDITIETKKDIMPIEMRANAALQLLEHIQYKYFAEQLITEADEKFEEFIKELDATVRGIKLWSGMIDE